jgi:glyoxylase-like metal-dependent hydrolase (beta-lactamase superfamily II)
LVEVMAVRTWLEATEVAGGVFRVRSKRVNCYLLRDGSALTLVDSGLPGHWPAIKAACATLGLGLPAIEAVLLTHVHTDHAGSAERARVEASASVRLHAGDAELADGRTRRKTERSLAAYLWRPAAVATVWELVTGGGLRMPAVGGFAPVEHGDEPDVPGRPAVIGLPGHTRGSIGFFLPERGVCFSGDALVTLNLLTGRRGPQLLGGAFMEDSRQALASLDRLAGLQADTLLPGHGDPWHGSMSDAVARAREAGPS